MGGGLVFFCFVVLLSDCWDLLGLAQVGWSWAALDPCPDSSWLCVVAVGWPVVGLGGARWVVSPPCTGACDLVVFDIWVSCRWTFSAGSSWVALGVDGCGSWGVAGRGSFVGWRVWWKGWCWELEAGVPILGELLWRLSFVFVGKGVLFELCPI